MIRNPQLVRRATARDVLRYRATDQMPGGNGRAFDAASASGLAFLTGELELIDTELVKPLQSVTHGRDLDIDVGGGFPELISAYAVDYRSVGTSQYGLISNDTTEAAEVQANITKGLYSVHLFGYNMTISMIDLEKLEFAKRVGQPAPFSLQAIYDDAIASLWAKALDYDAYLGFRGLPGLVNNPAVPETVVPNGAANHPGWATKTPTEILNDIVYLINAVASNAGYDETFGLPNRLLIPWTEFGRLLQPMTLNGIGFNSILDYLEQQVGQKYAIDFKINKLPNDWIATQGASSSERCVLYRKDKSAVYLKIPQPVKKMLTVPAAIGAGAYITTFAGCVSQVIWKRTQTAIYGDGLNTNT
jgi:hypothetical protein